MSKHSQDGESVIERHNLMDHMNIGSPKKIDTFGNETPDYHRLSELESTGTFRVTNPEMIKGGNQLFNTMMTFNKLNRSSVT